MSYNTMTHAIIEATTSLIISVNMHIIAYLSTLTENMLFHKTLPVFNHLFKHLTQIIKALFRSSLRLHFLFV